MTLNYKLTYFNMTGLGEPIRWVLKYANVPFEDKRFELYGDWPASRSQYPQGHLPVVHENGTLMTQSVAILRYLSKKYDLITGNAYLDYKVDEVVDITNDGRVQWVPVYFENDPEKKQAIIQRLTTQVFPDILKQLSDIVGSTRDGPFIAGHKVTFGDFFLTHWLQVFMNTMTPDLLKDYPVLTKQMEAVLNIPQIKKWVAERPKTSI